MSHLDGMLAIYCRIPLVAFAQNLFIFYPPCGISKTVVARLPALTQNLFIFYPRRGISETVVARLPALTTVIPPVARHTVSFWGEPGCGAHRVCIFTWWVNIWSACGLVSWFLGRCRGVYRGGCRRCVCLLRAFRTCFQAPRLPVSTRAPICLAGRKDVVTRWCSVWYRCRLPSRCFRRYIRRNVRRNHGRNLGRNHRLNI